MAGSFNYTGPANYIYINDENILVIGDLDEEDPVRLAEQKRLASFVKSEKTRIINVHGAQLKPVKYIRHQSLHFSIKFYTKNNTYFSDLFARKVSLFRHFNLESSQL